MKARHQEIPWSKVAGIGNVLRHEYGSVSAPVMWQLVKEHLPPLDQACRQEMAHQPRAGDADPRTAQVDQSKGEA
jgi:uncharacterized protein with HEPN domain